MNKLLKITDKEVGLYETFLDNVPYNTQFVEKPYDFKKVSDNEYAVWIAEGLVEVLQTFDHDCTASPEDGCSFCFMLMDLGLKPDYPDFEDLK
jgi:hypothetical protein